MGRPREPHGVPCRTDIGGDLIMRAAIFQGPHSIEVGERPDPRVYPRIY
jgi:hypothetical protein